MDNLAFYSKARSNRTEETSNKYQPHELLVMFRQRSELTKLQLAQLLGFKSERMVQMWEGGYSLPTAERLKKLLGIYQERHIFLPGKEKEEARQLWLAVKGMSDATNPGFEAYPVFDEAWFEAQTSNRQVEAKVVSLLPPAAGPASQASTTKKSSVRRHNLPVNLTPFIGRRAELAALTNWLQKPDRRLLTLTGPGGIGKTRLALEMTGQALDKFEDGVWLVELAPVSDPGLLPQVVAQSLGVREAPGVDITSTLSEYLQPRHLLLILDNCEHVLEGAVRLAGPLLVSCPGLQIVATSREVLRLPGELVWPVPGLSLPDIKEKSRVEYLQQYEAVQLFLERAAATNPYFRLTEQNALALAQLCHQLDGVPLALELAASWVRLLSVEQIKSRLSETLRVDFPFLAGRNPLFEARHETILALVDWSYSLLGVDERALWQRLTVFSGSFSLEAAEQVCADQLSYTEEKEPPARQDEAGNSAGTAHNYTGVGPQPPVLISRQKVLDLLLQLVNKSLLLVLPDEVLPRYRFLEMLRQYGERKLAESQETARWRTRHLEYYAGWVQQRAPELGGSDQNQVLARLEAEYDNLREALSWSLAAGNTPLLQKGLELAQNLSRFWLIRGYFSEGCEWLDRLQKAAQAAGLDETAAYAGLLQAAGLLTIQQGDYARTSQHLEQSRVLLEKLGDKRNLIVTILRLGTLASMQGNYTRAIASFQATLALGRELDDPQIIADSLQNLGTVALSQGDYLTARTDFETSLALNQQLGNLQGQSIILNNLGGVAFQQGDYAAAQGYYQQSLALKREIGHKRGIATTLLNLGEVALSIGHYHEARLYFQESLTIQSELNDKNGTAFSVHNLGLVALQQQDWRKAGQYLAENLNLLNELGDQNLLAHTLSVLVSLSWYWWTSQVENPASIGANHLVEAARLSGAVEGLLAAGGGVLGRLERKVYEQTVVYFRRHLGETDFQASFEAGKGLSFEEAIQLAWRMPLLG